MVNIDGFNMVSFDGIVKCTRFVNVHGHILSPLRYVNKEGLRGAFVLWFSYHIVIHVRHASDSRCYLVTILCCTLCQ